jgi:hypothetical protein
MGEDSSASFLTSASCGDADTRASTPGVEDAFDGVPDNEHQD